MKKLISALMLLFFATIFFNQVYAFGDDGICCPEDDSDCMYNEEVFTHHYFKPADENGNKKCGDEGPGNPIIQ